MLNTKRTRWIAVGALAALLFAAGAAVAGDHEGRRSGGHRRSAKVVKHRRQRVLKIMERLDALSDEQAKAAWEASKDLSRIREEARAKVAAIVLQGFREARAAPDQRQKIREATQAKLKALRGEYRAPFMEAGMKIVRTLTPGQKAKIEEGAKARRKSGGKTGGKTVTDEQLAKRFGARLAHPWAEALLKARIEGGATLPANK